MPTKTFFNMAASALLCVMQLSVSHAETFEVKMLNRNHTGAMAYEPDFLEIQPGDKVKFIATNSTHNAASIEGMIPAEATPFIGKINEEIEVSFKETGLYGIKCVPHYAMGMVMLVKVGQEPLEKLQIPAQVPARAQQRLQAIVQRASSTVAP